MPDLSKLFMYTGELQLEFIVWPIFIGICLGAFATVFIRVKLGELVRALITNGACSPETAQSLEALGLQSKFFIRNALKKHSSLRNVVSIAPKNTLTPISSSVTEETPEAAISVDQNAKIDVDGYIYYISDENRTRAEAIYDSTGSTIAVAFLTVILALAVAALSMYIIPNLIQMLENLIENIRN